MNRPSRPRRFILRFLSVAALSFLALFIVLLNIDAVAARPKDTLSNLDQFDGTFPWETTLVPPASASDYITYTDFRDDYCLYATSVNDCAAAASGKYIRFDTAEELYRFSVDVSFEAIYQSGVPAENYKLSPEKIALLLHLDYILGGDIDYAVMGAKTFIPIGYWFTDVESNLHKNIFTGTFDGRGFTISNLYLAGYDDMVYVDQVDELTLVDLAVAHYYSMFTYNAGTIQNVGLVNPTLELLDVHIDINKTSNLVGENQAAGLVDHVFVIDTRTSVTDAGIRYKVGTSTGEFTAAGIVHTNFGTFTNAYYSSKVVVNGSYINKFIVQPVLYTSTGTANHLVYDSTVYLLAVTVGTSTFYVATPNAYAVGESTSTLKSTSSSLNSETDRWYFYASDSYPRLLGLAWNASGSYYEIADAIDLVAFSRILSYVTMNNGVSYAAASYRLIDDIDMSEVAPNAYVTPAVTFTGALSGQHGTTLDENYYIYNLHMTNGIVRETNYYAGLFSILSTGSVSDLNIIASSITIADSETYYSNVFGVGFVAGRMIGGTLANIQLDVDIDLGTKSIGETHAGLLVGRASGTIDQVSVSGTLDGGIHVFQSALAIAPRYYLGGIVGAVTGNQLAITDSVSNASILGFSTTSTFGMATGSYAVAVKIGGIAGYLVNTASIHHRLVGVANKGTLTVRPVTTANDVSGYASQQNVGGVFGELAGSAPLLESAGTYLFANLYNSGGIIAAYAASTAAIRAAGIGVSNTTESTEYALLFNHAGFTYDATGFSGYTHFQYTATIMDISAYNAAITITLSRVYNEADFVLSSPYHRSFSPLYLSLNNNNTILRYSANYGDISFLNNGGASTLTLVAATTIAGITTSTNVDFQNVHQYGAITIVSVNLGAYPLTVAGITGTLSSGKKIVNSLNQGAIVFANVTGTANIYVGGLVGVNNAGDLQNQDASSQPVATVGIIDSINDGTITTTYSGSYYGVNGTSNTFVGGIAALNSGSIQNTANLGDIRIYNSITNGTFTAQTDTSYAGRVSAYTAGISAGGIVGAILSGNSRIYDIANSGAIVAVATKYARAGGILAVSLYSEASAGGLGAGQGLADTIQNSILANGLNFGDVAAITSTIASYGTGSASYTTFTFYYGNGSSGATHYLNTKSSSEERPAVYSSAGGVIGYGLCKMRRMLNHGTIAATDVAGGIVGATYVLGGSASPYPTTVVDINTAINYGDIKSIDYLTYGSIGKVTLAIGAGNYMDDGNTFIFPTGYSRLAPLSKRGFGGVFGRLQRGTNGTMTSATGSFDFIVNADPDVDLIGRLDQVVNYSSSSRYFIFNNAIYYSAKPNDTTQVVFTGFYYSYGAATATSGSAIPYTIVSTATTLYKQVGLTGTQYSSPASSFVWQAGAAMTVGTSYYSFYAPVLVPYITEAEAWNSDFTDYIYDENFVMRKETDTYSANVSREYTIDGSNNLKNPEGATVIASTVLFNTLAEALAYKAANPSSTPYYKDAENDIRNLAGERVFAYGNPYSLALAYKYHAELNTYSSGSITTPYTPFTIDGSGNLLTSTATVASTYIFADSASAASYDQVYNTAFYRKTSGGSLGLYNTSSVRTHSTTDSTNYTYLGSGATGNAANNLWRNSTGGSFYLASNHTVKAIDATMIFTSQTAANAYVKKLLFYWTGTAGASNLQQYNGSILYTYVSGTTFTYNNKSYVYTSGNMVEGIAASLLYTNLETAYTYKAAHTSAPVYYKDAQGQIQMVSLKSAYYLSTNFTINTSGNLVDSVGATVIAAADLDGSPYTINATTHHITNASGVVLYTFIPSLTKYIYYLENALLADRFVTERPNGMYVLSTTAGSTYGLVIPSNIAIERIRGINEDHEPAISLLIDYDHVSVGYLQELDTDLTDAFEALKQSTFNDKSNLIEETASSVVLTQDGGAGTVLTNPTVDYDARTLTFMVSMEAFPTGGVSVSYAVTDALTSAYALIAERASDYYGHAPSEAELEAYNNLLYPERASGISTSYPALLTVTLPSRDIAVNTAPTLLGSFTVYSEAFVGSDLFATASYYSDYAVYVVFTPRIGVGSATIAIATVQFNGATAQTVLNQSDVTGLGAVDYNGSIRFNFTYTQNLLAEGYDFANLITVKAADGTVVDPGYYALASVPAASGTYAVTITFSALTKSGNYAMFYRYFPSSTEQSVLFHKNPSNVTAITGLDYYSEDGSTVIAGTTITGAANVGWEPEIGPNGGTWFSATTDAGIASYLDGTTYLPDFMTTGSFVIAPFAVLTNVYLDAVTYDQGYKTFDIVYVLTAEDGTTTTTYHHYITGRPIDLVSVLKNGNEVFLDDVYAVREDATTVFTVDLGLDQTLELYRVDPGPSNDLSYFGINVTAVELDGVTDMTASITGLTYDTNDYLLIHMSYETLPGIYTFHFVFYRDGSTDDYITIATPLVITKRAGTNPFLSDIRFSELANETSYPTIAITEPDGDLLEGTGYDPRVYFGGIDYDGADLYPYYSYRVDGQVSNTPLNEYMPYLLEYLPYGGTVSRRVYDLDTHTWSWSAEVGADGVGQSALYADFTLEPDAFTADAVTGFDPTKYADLVVLYRITSEDGAHATYYYVTVTDVVYNVTLVFDIYYCEDSGYDHCTIAKSSVDFQDQLVVVLVKNYATDGDANTMGVYDPALFPDFSTINGLNNQVTQFYYTHDSSYRYSFGRNISGFYTFQVRMPQDQYLNEVYYYEIKYSYGLVTYTLTDASEYVEGLDGKYFYIEPSTRNRTRRFNVYIHPIETPDTGAPWGLFDFFRSWWD